MATLTGNAINTSYSGLLKTTDNGALTATAKVMTDGLGNNSTLQMGTAGAIFTGTLDLTGATVTGLPVDPNTTYDLASAQDGSNVDITLTGSDTTVDTVQLTAGTNITLTEAAGSITIDAAGGGGGSAGLINGTPTNSLKNADALVTTGAAVLGNNDIAVGNNARVTFSSAANLYYGGDSIAIGNNAQVDKEVDYSFKVLQGSVAIGAESFAALDGTGAAVALGYKASAQDGGVAIGGNDSFSSTLALARGVAIGLDAQQTSAGGNAVTIGNDAKSQGSADVTIGHNSFGSGNSGFQTGNVAIGDYAKATGDYTIAIGANCATNTQNVIAIGAGNNLTANAPTNTIVLGYGNTVDNANQRVILISNNQNMDNSAGANDTVMIGASLERDAGNDTSNSVQIGLLSKLGSSNTVAIGRQAYASAGGGAAIGRNSTASGDNSFAGVNSTASESLSAAFNGVTTTTANTTAVANLEVIGAGNSIKLTSPDGTVFSVTVSNAGALVVA